MVDSTNILQNHLTGAIAKVDYHSDSDKTLDHMRE